MRDFINDLDPVVARHMPLSERVLDKLADILLAADDILAMLASAPLPISDSERQIERSIRDVYDEVNELMKGIAD